VVKLNFAATGEQFLEEKQSGIARGWWCHDNQDV